MAHLGLSVDWSRTYATIDRRAQRVSQAAFLRLLKKGVAYQLEAPTLWDVDFRTAVAQAELEDREQPGAYHRIRFGPSPTAPGRAVGDRDDAAGADPGVRRAGRASRRRAVQAAVRHATCSTPLFGVPVPVKAHSLADPEKGSGIAMICTFGDLTDVTWWRELSLPVRAVIMPNGAFRAGDVGLDRAGRSRDAAGRRRPTTSWPICRRRRRARASSSCCASRATCSASRGRSRTR